jgi:uncharacterized repeat protein (TIGR01451 family)
VASISKSATQEPTGVGIPFNYTLTISNSGDLEMTDATIKDTMPTNIHAVATDRQECTITPQQSSVTCSFDMLNPGQTQTVVITAVADVDGAFENTANLIYKKNGSPQPPVTTSANKTVQVSACYVP